MASDPAPPAQSPRRSRLTRNAIVGVALPLILATALAVVGVRGRDGLAGPYGEYFLGREWAGTPVATEAHGTLTTASIAARARQFGDRPFCAVWTGTLAVAQPGTYVFAVVSDDGGWLLVDDALVVDDGGSHSMRRVEGRMPLAAGPHTVVVKYNQDVADVGLEVTVRGPDGQTRPLGPLLKGGGPFWGLGWRPASVFAIVADLWSAALLGALVAWPFRRFVARVRAGASRTEAAVVVGLVVAVAALAVFGIGWGLPVHRSWAPDELIPIDILHAIDRRFAGLWYDVYPPGQYYVLALLQAPLIIGARLGLYDLADPLSRTSLFVIARGTSAVMAAGTAAALYLTCRALGHGWRAATLAVVVAVTTPLFVYYGRVANVDMPYLFWFALALYVYALIVADGATRSRHAALGAAAALSVTTKDQAYAFFPVIALHVAWLAYVRATGGVGVRLRRTVTDAHLWTGLGVFALVFAVVNNLVFNRAAFAAHLGLIAGEWSQNYRMFERSPAGQWALLQSTAIELPWCLGWLALAAAALGGWITLRRRDTATAAVVVVPILSWYLTLIAVIGYQYDRFLLGVCLGLAILAGVGLDWILVALKPRALARAVVAAVLAVSVLTGASIPILMHTDDRYAVERWLAAQPPAAVIAFVGHPQYLPRLEGLGAVGIAPKGGALGSVKPALLVTSWQVLAAIARPAVSLGVLRRARGRLARLSPCRAAARARLDAPRLDRPAVVRPVRCRRAHAFQQPEQDRPGDPGLRARGALTRAAWPRAYNRASMEDLTTGSLLRHLLRTASFMLVTMLSQTLYFLIDLYWVGSLGKEAVAAVGIAGNLSFVVLALTQVLGVGTTTLISHASGARNRERAREVFHQALWLAAFAAVVFLAVAQLSRRAYVASIAADPVTAGLADAYLLWFVPALALQFLLATMAAALRGTGAFRAPMLVQVVTVAINIVLAPILIFGWGTGRPFGVAGAAIASLVAIAVGIVWLSREFAAEEAYLRLRVAEARPQPALWRPLVAIGLPAGAEFGLMALSMFVIYAVARPFGAAAQAGFGIGLRLVQSLFLPVVALGFSVAPVAGQNVGAGRFDRVRATLRAASGLAVSLMVVVGVACQFAAPAFVGVFSDDLEVVAVGSDYLRIIAWGFAASGIVFVTSSLFQALGRTLPPLLTSTVRNVLVFVPVLWLAARPGFDLRVIWYLMAASVCLHAAANWMLVQRQIRLAEAAAAAAVVP